MNHSIVIWVGKKHFDAFCNEWVKVPNSKLIFYIYEEINRDNLIYLLFLMRFIVRNLY